MDTETRALEHAAQAAPDDRGALLRWLAALHRSGALVERSFQEMLAQRVARFDAATRAELVLRAHGLELGSRPVRAGELELVEFDFNRAGADWTVQCHQARFEEKHRVPTGRRIDLNIFGKHDRGYEDVSTRTLVRLLAETPATFEMFNAWDDAAVIDQDPEFQAFMAELTAHGARFERFYADDRQDIVGFGGYFGFAFEEKPYQGSWNNNYPARYGPSTEIFTREGAPARFIRMFRRPDSLDMQNFTHALDVIEALRRGTLIEAPREWDEPEPSADEMREIEAAEARRARRVK